MLNRLCADYYHGKIKDNIIINFIKSIPAGESLLDVGAGEMPYKIFVIILTTLAKISANMTVKATIKEYKPEHLIRKYRYCVRYINDPG